MAVFPGLGLGLAPRDFRALEVDYGPTTQVFHAGYGSLIERRRFENGAFVTGGGEYLTTSRGLFFKASYLARF